MRGEPAGGRERGMAVERPVTEEQRERLVRRLSLLLGLVPLVGMTQDEADWVFRQRVRQAE